MVPLPRPRAPSASPATPRTVGCFTVHLGVLHGAVRRRRESWGPLADVGTGRSPRSPSALGTPAARVVPRPAASMGAAVPRDPRAQSVPVCVVLRRAAQGARVLLLPRMARSVPPAAPVAAGDPRGPRVRSPVVLHDAPHAAPRPVRRGVHLGGAVAAAPVRAPSRSKRFLFPDHSPPPKSTTVDQLITRSLFLNISANIWKGTYIAQAAVVHGLLF